MWRTVIDLADAIDSMQGWMESVLEALKQTPVGRAKCDNDSVRTWRDTSCRDGQAASTSLGSHFKFTLLAAQFFTKLPQNAATAAARRVMELAIALTDVGMAEDTLMFVARAATALPDLAQSLLLRPLRHDLQEAAAQASTGAGPLLLNLYVCGDNR
jgi:hypothetical protein